MIVVISMIMNGTVAETKGVPEAQKCKHNNNVSHKTVNKKNEKNKIKYAHTYILLL